MKQLLQNLRNGDTILADVPAPAARAGHLTVRTTVSLISAGTERMLVEFGKAGWIDKARQQPDKVAMVLNKIRTDGLAPTLEAVFNKLDEPLPLGYCNVGVVVEVGAGVRDLTVGDRVASNGKHAQFVTVPRNLCAKVPAEVSDEEAAFVVIGAIGLQGIRLAQPTLGESVVVMGLGLIGLIVVQLLRAHGCRVLGLDFDPARLALAKQFGAETVDLSTQQDPVAFATVFSRGRGVDAVLITASTRSSEPVHQAAQMCRKRGRIVLVGVTGLELSRADFYEKELTFQVSCSYGPGRYDPQYEEGGFDYPAGFVRWTEQRNFEAVLDMMATKQVDVRSLISHRFQLHQAEEAYRLLASGSKDSLGIVLDYPVEAERENTVRVSEALSRRSTIERAVVGVIGAGNYASRILVPALAAAGADLKIVASSGGVSAAHLAAKHGFECATTSVDAILRDESVNVVIIATRHDTHARFACQALDAGKHVFVEKPLALTRVELDSIKQAQARSEKMLCVGFNRRFAPLVVQAAAQARKRVGPLAVVITVNAGELPSNHWTQAHDVGGGRILGEGCHFVDLARFLVGAPIRTLQVVTATSPSLGRAEDISSLHLSFDDGSIAAIQYLANGNRGFPKERIELFWDSKTVCVDNFRRMRGWGLASAPRFGSRRQDKGQRCMMQKFIDGVTGKAAHPPIPLIELFEVSEWAIEAGRQAMGLTSE